MEVQGSGLILVLVQESVSDILQDQIYFLNSLCSANESLLAQAQSLDFPLTL